MRADFFQSLNLFFKYEASLKVLTCLFFKFEAFQMQNFSEAWLKTLAFAQNKTQKSHVRAITEDINAVS
jgi:hypothetical protein